MTLRRIYEECLLEQKLTDLFINSDGKVFKKPGMVSLGIFSKDEVKELCLILASSCEVFLNTNTPVVESILPGGQRISIFCPPLVNGFALALRNPSPRILKLKDFNLSLEQVRILEKAVADKKNILLIGGTGSGKTTLASALVDLIALEERLVILEEISEIMVRSERHYERLLTTKNLDLSALLIHSLRMNPNRLLVGEVRGIEAYHYIQSLNTGHSGGITTIHANGCQDGLRRLTNLVCLVGVKIDEQFLSCIDILVFMENLKVKEILVINE